MGINFLETKSEINGIRLDAYDRISDLVASSTINDPIVLAREVISIVVSAEKEVAEVLGR